jgi:peptidoglycan/LPS O-acetylase OafA/YrhL
LPRDLAVNLKLGRLPSLDGLRALAAFSVVFYHCGMSWCPGGLGVLAFFVLSGFLITWLLGAEEEAAGRIDWKAFYLRRSLRIFPAFYVYWILLMALLLVLHKRPVMGQSIAAFFYVNNYYQALFGDPNTGFSHTWSLGIEEQFYLLWPPLFLLLKRNGRRIQALAAGILAVWVYREILIFRGCNQGYIYEAFETRADHLMIGCLLALVLRGGIWARFWRKVCSAAAAVYVTLALIILSVAMGLHFGSVYRDGIGFILDPVLVAILIAQCVSFPGGAFGRLLNQNWMVYLGTISYSTYLYQQVLIEPIAKAAARAPALRLPATVAGVILAASASHYLVERPFLRLKSRLTRGPAGSGQRSTEKLAAARIARS